MYYFSFSGLQIIGFEALFPVVKAAVPVHHSRTPQYITSLTFALNPKPINKKP